MTQPVRFGLQLCVQHPAADDMSVRFSEVVEQVHLARDIGFDSIVVGQHYLSEPLQMLQPLPLLARLAPESGDMSLAACILLVALQNPVDIAEQVASLDLMSEGRLRVGMGLGYRGVEFDAFGVVRHERVRRFVRNVDIITRLLEGEAVTVDEPDIRLDDVRMTLRSKQSLRPPIWMGANSDTAIRRAAKMADSWVLNPHGGLASLARQVHEVYLPELERLGQARPADLPIRREIFVAKDRETAIAESAPWLMGKYNVYTRWGQHTALPSDDSWSSEFDQLRKERFIVGDPDDCDEQIHDYRERLGVTEFIICVQWPGMPHKLAMSNLTNFGEHIVSRFKSSTELRT